jgi:dolichyl-phosphate-mannose--protein O-mannosyl transferase
MSAAVQTDELVAAGEVPPSRPPADADLTDPGLRLGRPMPTDRVRGWLVTLVIGLIGAVVRFQNLGLPTDKGTPVFDEKHYVPQAAQALRNGGYEDNPGYDLIVHPPLGKQLLAVGEWLFGYNGIGWRFTAALCGLLMIIMIVRIARRLTRSTLLGAVAGVLLICDGLSHVQSRSGMLDVFQAVFVLAAFGAILIDRDVARSRLAVAMRERFVTESRFGPYLGFRWWRFGAGVLLGLACAVKWGGVFYILAFGLLTLLWDATARRSAGVARPWLGAVVRDLQPALWNLLAIALLTYLATWWAWFGSETALDRHLVDGVLPKPGNPGFLGNMLRDLTGWNILPDALRSLFYYSGSVMDFHEHLLTPKDHPHPWESKPWGWPMGIRPMLYYYESGPAAAGCGTSNCVRATMLIGTPAMWWLALPTLAWSLWRMVGRLDWRYAAVVVGYCGGFLPWFLNLDRQMYFFYMTPVAPFLVLGITLVLGEILGAANAGHERRWTGLAAMSLYIGLVVANFIWLWPILNGNSITPDHWQAELWLPSWR